MGARQFDSQAADERDEVDLNGVAAALGRNKRLVARATLGAAAAALLFCLVSSPRYMAEARLLVENQESYFTSASPEGARDGEMTQVARRRGDQQPDPAAHLARSGETGRSRSSASRAIRSSIPNPRSSPG